MVVKTKNGLKRDIYGSRRHRNEETFTALLPGSSFAVVDRAVVDRAVRDSG
jgi:hypothetical protein